LQSRDPRLSPLAGIERAAIAQMDEAIGAHEVGDLPAGLAGYATLKVEFGERHGHVLSVTAQRGYEGFGFDMRSI